MEAKKKNYKQAKKIKKKNIIKIILDNPNHLEDFNWLLEQAVKPPASK